MSGVSTASAYIAYQAGYKALQGVDQPTANPAKKLTKVQKSSTRPTEFEPVDEKMILIKVYDYIHAQEKKSGSELSSEKTKKKKYEKTSQNQLDYSQFKNVLVGNFPINIKDGAVILETAESNNSGAISY